VEKERKRGSRKKHDAVIRETQGGERSQAHRDDGGGYQKYLLEESLGKKKTPNVGAGAGRGIIVQGGRGRNRRKDNDQRLPVLLRGTGKEAKEAKTAVRKKRVKKMEKDARKDQNGLVQLVPTWR